MSIPSLTASSAEAPPAETGFALHPQLAADCLAAGDLPLCRLLLMNNAGAPWLILVPRRASLRELHDLADADYAQACEEIRHVSRVLQRLTQADKMNVAALGNQVLQLHVHIIARKRSDAAWPQPVWGNLPARPYDAANADRLLAGLAAARITKM